MHKFGYRLYPLRLIEHQYAIWECFSQGMDAWIMDETTVVDRMMSDIILRSSRMQHRGDERPTVTITTDGAACGNPGAGGWAVLLQFGDHERLLSGEESGNTINNSMAGY